MKRSLATVLAAAGGAMAFAAHAVVTGKSVTLLTAAQSEKYGAYVADGDRRALYMFTADTRGGKGRPATSACYDACAAAWPPALAERSPDAADRLRADLVGTVARKDGTRQLTYGGWPLYYFTKDLKPGDVTGQDVHGFGGEWYLVAPDGEAIRKES